MEGKKDAVLFCFLALFFMWTSVTGLLSSKGVNSEGASSLPRTIYSITSTNTKKHYKLIFVEHAVQALMGIKSSLMDPHSALNNWDAESVDPCNWAMVTCSPDHFVIAL